MIDQAIHAFFQVSVLIPSSNWIFIAVYASLDLNTCFHLWEGLSFFASSYAMPWNFASNFNDVLGNYENLSYSPPNQNHMFIFNNLLNNCNLLGLSYNCPCFTWTNKRDSRLVMKCLDRALCNLDWQLLFEDTNVFHLLRTSFDHHPILIDTFPSTSDSTQLSFLT